MTIEEALQAKQGLEERINSALDQFTADTGLRVADVRFGYIRVGSCSQPGERVYRTEVLVELR